MLLQVNSFTANFDGWFESDLDSYVIMTKWWKWGGVLKLDDLCMSQKIKKINMSAPKLKNLSDLIKNLAPKSIFDDFEEMLNFQFLEVSTPYSGPQASSGHP